MPVRFFLLLFLCGAFVACNSVKTPRSGLDPRRVDARVDGKPVALHVLENRSGMEVCLCNFGAAIGRYANRIAGARFELDGQTALLSANSGPNCLHGGVRGWQARVFDVERVPDSTVRFAYLSPDGEEGFPGNVRMQVEYRLTDDNALSISYSATSDRPTVVNPTNHTFFNLSGDPSQTALDHRLQIDADGIQIFTANAFHGAFEGRRAIAYRNRPAVCLETQYFPDSPNHPNWPSTVLRPGEVRRGACVCTVSLSNKSVSHENPQLHAQTPAVPCCVFRVQSSRRFC